MDQQETKASHAGRRLKKFRIALIRRFSLLNDKAEDAEIERRIRDGVDLSGATPWILIFAIFVASVGLNVNSTAVIIGAMLISPLMGPIMGVGLGAAVYDFDLVKRALSNLAIATLISLVVSALYFWASPLQEAQSELLARTSPTVWDVLIALFGGLAGIVGITRQEKSNVIPGVAIATALMPPVCTAGFGIATGQWNYVGGALYLYTINCVFIALATAIGIRVLRLKRHGFTDLAVERRVKLSLFLIAVGTAVPSTYLAFNLVKDEVFKSNATKFVAQEFAFKDTQVATTKIDPDKRTIELALIGLPLNGATLQTIEGRLAMASLEGAKIVVHQTNDNRVDVIALKSSLLSDLYTNGQEALRLKDEQVKKLEVALAARNALFDSVADISAELRAQYPQVSSIFLSEGSEVLQDGTRSNLLQLSVRSAKPFNTKDKQRIENWIKVRTKSKTVVTVFVIKR